jgi:hypothetical protein
LQFDIWELTFDACHRPVRLFVILAKEQRWRAPRP